MNATHFADSVLSVRVSLSERAMLEAAAAQCGATLDEFIRLKAIEAARPELHARHAASRDLEFWDKAAHNSGPTPEDLCHRVPTWDR